MTWVFYARLRGVLVWGWVLLSMLSPADPPAGAEAADGTTAESPPQLRENEPLVVQLGPEDPMLEGHGPSKTISLTTTIRGSAFIQADSSNLAFVLQVRNAEGTASMTAEELASLDLSGCELAVLSACQTNVGLQRGGEGIASLQQALMAAGVRTAVTSLWKVPDEATRDLMVDFYRRLWIQGKPKAQALWEAKQKLRRKRDANGRPVHPTRDWAGWVLSGDPK